MKDIIEYMNKAKITLIGYDSISEQKVDNIISNFCDQTHFIDFVNSNENAIALMRDLKILYLTNNSGHVVIETDDLNNDDMNVFYQFLRTTDLPFKVIIKNRVYITGSPDGGIFSVRYKGGQQIIYQAQLVFNIINNDLKIIKNNIYSYSPNILWDKKEYESDEIK